MIRHMQELNSWKEGTLKSSVSTDTVLLCYACFKHSESTEL